MRRKPSLSRLAREYAHLFALNGLRVRCAYASLEWLEANGICFPLTSGRECWIMLDDQLAPDDVLPILLHELIHAEQYGQFGSCDHGSYFKLRVDELIAAGYRVADHTGAINAAE